MPPTNQQPSSRLRLQAGHWSDPGRQRQENEDSYGVSASQAGGRLAQRGTWQIAPEQQLAERGTLFVVADGVGGHNAGATASALATQVIFREYYSGPFAEPRAGLARAIDAANQAIMAQSGSGDAALSDMGTTAVAAVVRGDEATVAHVGDSRCYLVNRAGVQQLTQDHTWVSDQLQAGVLTEEEAQRHPYRHVLSRTLGRSDAAPDVLSLRLQAGDRLVLCSDGLSNVVAPHEIQDVVLRYAPQVAAEQLVALANQRGGPDNITAVVVQGDETAAGNGGAVAGLSAWLASLPRQWLAAGVLGFAAMACLVLFAINGVVGTVQGPTPTSTKTRIPTVESLIPTTTIESPIAATMIPATPGAIVIPSPEKPTSVATIPPSEFPSPASVSDLQSTPSGPPQQGWVRLPTFLFPAPTDDEYSQNPLGAGKSIIIIDKNVQGKTIFGTPVWYRVRVTYDSGDTKEGYVHSELIRVGGQ